MRWPFSKPDKHNQCFVKRFVSTYDFRGTWVEIHDRAILDSYHDDIVRIATYLQKIKTPRTRCSLHEEFFSISHVCDSWREDE